MGYFFHFSSLYPALSWVINGWWHRFGSVVYVHLFTFLLQQRKHLSFWNSYFYRFLCCHHPLITQLTLPHTFNYTICVSLSKFHIWILALPKMAGSAQTHKNISFVCSTLYVYLCNQFQNLNSDFFYTFLSCQKTKKHKSLCIVSWA